MNDLIEKLGRYGVLGLAAITIAGCSEPRPICHEGILYSDNDGDGIYINSGGWAETYCVDPAQGMAAGTDATGTGAAEGNSPTPQGDAPDTPEDASHAN